MKANPVLRGMNSGPEQMWRAAILAILASIKHGPCHRLADGYGPPPGAIRRVHEREEG
jgi:hypothetical protein